MPGESETFSYVRDSYPSAFLRRLIIALAGSILLTVSVSGWLQLLRLIPHFADSYAAFAAKLEFQKDVRFLPWGGWAHFAVAIAITGYALRTKIPRALDFFLFSPFDDRVLEPINRYTGLFVWDLPKAGDTRDAWNSLLNWIVRDARGARWEFSWVARAAARTPVRLILLLGDSGIKDPAGQGGAQHWALSAFSDRANGAAARPVGT